MAVELKYQGDVDTILNIDIEGEDAQKAIELLHKGIRMNKIDHEYADLKKQNETWNQMLDGAKNDDEKLQQLVGMLEGYVGRPLTKAEKEDLSDGAGSAQESDVVQKLMKEITELKTKTDNFEKIQLGREVQSAHLENKKFYEGKDGFPVYDPKEVEMYLEKNPIYTPDITKNYRIAYEQMHAEKIEEAKKTHWVNSEKNRKDTIDKNRTESGDGVANTPPKDDIVSGMSWDDAAKAILEDVKSSGKSLVTDD